jgi:hypothetical protein
MTGPLPTSSGPAARRVPWNTLTDRDLAQFMRLIAAGYDRHDLMKHLVLSSDGVARRRKSAMERLGARNMAHAVHLAHLAGWFPETRPSGRPLRPCGTYAAYRRHERRREPIDDRCKAAYNAERAAMRQRSVTKH